jgi:hypothetical protein
VASPRVGVCGIVVLALLAGCSTANNAPHGSPLVGAPDRNGVRTFHFVDDHGRTTGDVDLTRHRLQQRSMLGPGDEIEEIDDGPHWYLRSPNAVHNRGWCLGGKGTPKPSWGLVRSPFEARSTFLTGPEWQRVGDQIVNGVSTTHYSMKVASSAAVDVWIDAQDRARRYSVALPSYLQTINYTNFGVPILIQVPDHVSLCPGIPGA